MLHTAVSHRQCRSRKCLSKQTPPVSDGLRCFFSRLLPAVIGDWLESLKRYASEPLATAFPTITNDPNDLRSYPKGANEVNARTIKPKVKDFDPSKRIVGIPGFNAFGSPSSKQDLPL